MSIPLNRDAAGNGWSVMALTDQQLADQQLADLQGQASTRSTMPSASYLALLDELRASRVREAEQAEALDDLWGCIGAAEIAHLQEATRTLAEQIHEKLNHVLLTQEEGIRMGIRMGVDFAALAEEAERGYDITDLKPTGRVTPRADGEC